MKDIKVLFTACNGLTTPGTIDCLREVDERKITIVGVDVVELGAASRFVDSFYKVPSAYDKKYVDVIFDICQKESIDVVVPKSDEEVLILSKNKKRFLEINTIIAVNDFSISVKSSDKGTFLQHITDEGLPCAKFRIPKNIEEFERHCYELGYPAEPVIIKPRLGRGNRGVRIIQKKS